MGLTKNYLRYIHESTFGLVAASHSGASIQYLRMRSTTDRFVAVPANESVYFWDLKTKQIINRLNYDTDDAAEVTVIICYHGGHPRTNLIAVGYANGHVKVFEYETGQLKVNFTGHRTAISALAFDRDGSRLASGGKDCNIVVWDVVGEKGLFSLKGHKNIISKLSFLYNDEHQKDIMISSSIDAVSTIKFWDLQTQHCFCTLPGHSSGTWSFVVLKDGTRLVTGSTSPELRVYSIEFLSEKESKLLDSEDQEMTSMNPTVGSSEVEYGLRVKHLGNILRNSNSISNRVQDIVLDEDATLMICHSTDKNIELYAIRNKDEALTYAKKQAKKALRKQAKRKLVEDDTIEEQPDDERAKVSTVTLDTLAPQSLVDCEFNRKLGCQKLSDRVKALAVTRVASKNGARRFRLAVMSATNKVESYLVEPGADKPEDSLQALTDIDGISHRTDVRSVAISRDNALILTSSAECLKIWRLDSRSCIATIETDYSSCCAFAEAENLTTIFENRFALIGTKQGSLQIVDIGAAEVAQTIPMCINQKPLNSICALPDKSGIVCGGEDGIARFFNYHWKTTSDEEEKKAITLSLEEDRDLTFQEGITCVKISPNGKFLAVALLDSTVRVHFVDTFKFFLNMYGHKFPVTTLDISSDNTLLVTGSADKNIKIWGLDFGDCHKSIFAHDDAITCVKFVPKTHHVFSCGRDSQIKEWDCDHFIKIQTLRKHQAEIWCLDISSNGKYVVTGSHDKSIRLYRKTEEILVPSEEEEVEREAEDERNVFEKQENIVLGEVSLETGFASKMTVDTVKSADRLMEAIDISDSEQAKELEHMKLCEIAESKGEPKPTEPEHDPLLMTASTTDYNRFMLEVLRKIKSSELEEILLTLPFDYVIRLLTILVRFLERDWDIELMVRCATFLLKINFGRIVASPSLVPIVFKLKAVILDKATNLRDCTGFNLMALEHLGGYRTYVSTDVD